jgi:UDP-N-acetyl-D-mannosaminuronic acid transferase (WecB/TagA/CpsF family)
MSPLSSEMMNDLRSAVSPSRVMSSALRSQRVYFIGVARDVAAASEQALKASAPDGVTCARRTNSRKKRTSLGLKARNHRSMSTTHNGEAACRE